MTVAEAEEAAARIADLSLEATVALAEVAGAVKDGSLAFASATNLVVMFQMMQAELGGRIGPKHAEIGVDERVGNWHGTTRGPMVLGGGTVITERPRGRTTDGAEIELDIWKMLSSTDLLAQLVVERMLAGVATRRQVDDGRAGGRRSRGPGPLDVQVGRLQTLRGCHQAGPRRSAGPEQSSTWP